MKKILVAATVMALFGAVQAQTVSGTMRYDMTKVEDTALATGIAKSEIVFGASEDLGNGMSLTARMGLNGAASGETVAGKTAPPSK